MAENSSDCVALGLLCTETESFCFDDLDSLTKGQQKNEINVKDLSFTKNGGRSDGLIDLPKITEESFSFMVQKEIDFLPKDDYLKRLRIGDLDLSVRREALDWIWKACMHYGFGELCFCLSINYMDRFLSLYELPRKTWAVQLLSVACLSIAAKMEEIHVPSIVDLQVGNPKFVFEGKTIQKMELLVLSTLKWRVQAYTPCTFIDYFVRKMNGDQIPPRPLISKSMQLILSSIRGIDFLEFRSSEIAAAVAISVSREMQANDIDKAMPCFFIHVQKDRVLKCLELIQDLTLVSGTMTSARTITTTASVPSVPQSPNGVLEAACLSYKSDETKVGSHTSPDNKRRKLDTSLENGT